MTRLMKTRFHILFVALSVFTLCEAQQSNNEKINVFKLGNTKIQLVENQTGSKSKIIFVNVHEDEQTSIDVLKGYSSEQEINYCYLSHDSVRRLTFESRDNRFSIDPNRIFTKKGVKRTIQGNVAWKKREVRQVKRFGVRLSRQIIGINYTIALHNNTPDNYSILSYLPDGDESGNTQEVYVNSEMDPDDFVYTTDSLLFNELKVLKINTILQKENPVDDGSLSVLCGMKGIPYANIETEHGHYEEQLELVRIVHDIVLRLTN